MARSLCVLLTLALVGCGGDSPTAPPPPPPFSVNISAPATVASTPGKYPNGSARKECDIGYTAAASGGATGSFADWQSATFRMYSGAGAMIYQEDWSIDEMADFWGSTRLPTGGSQSSLTYTWWNETGFSIQATFRYLVGGSDELRSAFVQWQCV